MGLALFPVRLLLANCQTVVAALRFALWLRALDFEAEMAAGLAEMFDMGEAA